MSQAAWDLTTTAEALRRAFDRSFAEARGTSVTEHEDLLAVRIGGEAYALRLDEISGLHVDRPIVPLPSPVPELLGIASLRGGLVPVYDLRRLLAHAAGPTPRWLALTRASPVVGLAFEHFEGHVRLPATRLPMGPGAPSASPHLRGAVHLDVLRPIIDLSALRTTISRRAPARGPHQEA